MVDRINSASYKTVIYRKYRGDNMKYTRPTYANEEIEVVDVINASIVKVAYVPKEITTEENGELVTKEVTATQVSVDISNLF